MSLAYFLSTYPQAILDDDTTVVLLGVLERQGASTTGELARVMGRGPEDVTARVVALYANQFVTVEGDVIRLNVRGKTLLDRFAVGNAVISDLLSEAVPDDEIAADRGALESLLNAFRSDAYLNYLATLRTQRLLSDVRHRDAEIMPGPAAIRLALLFRDVDDWTMHSSSPAARDASRQLDDLFAHAIKAAAEGSEEPARAIVLFGYLRPESPRANSTQLLWWRSHTRLDKGSYQQVFKLDNLQRHRSPRAWLHASCLAARSSTDDPLTAIEHHLAREWDTLESQLDEVELEQGADPLREVPPVNDALASLLGSTSRAAFASALGVTDDVAIVFLQQIRAKCDTLISPEGQGDDAVT